MKNISSKLKVAMAVFVLFASVALAFHTQAQDMADIKNKTPEQRAQLQTSLMKSKLQLDAGQIVKAQAINLKYAQKMEPVIKGNDGKLKKYRVAMSIMKDKDAEFKKILSAEQYKHYQDFEEELKKKARDHLDK